MPCIHDLPDWPAFVWNSDRLAPLLAEARYKQGMLLGRMQNLAAQIKTDLHATVLRQDLLAGPDENSPRFEQGLRGIYEDLRKNRDRILTASTLLRWHAGLFPGRDGAGTWRDLTERGERLDRKEPLRERAGPKEREINIPREIQAFLAWFNFGVLPPKAVCAQTGKAVSTLWDEPLIKAGIAHFWFLAIKPFTEASALLAGSAAQIVLLRAHGLNEPVYPLAFSLRQNRAAREIAFGRARPDTLEITPWLDCFLRCLCSAAEDSERILERMRQRDGFIKKIQGTPLNKRQRNIAEHMIKTGIKRISTGMYAELGQCSPDSALRDLHELIRAGIMRRNAGGGRSTSYSLKNYN